MDSESLWRALEALKWQLWVRPGLNLPRTGIIVGFSNGAVRAAEARHHLGAHALWRLWETMNTIGEVLAEYYISQLGQESELREECRLIYLEGHCRETKIPATSR